MVIKGWTIDIAAQEGSNLDEDLWRRDFRLNAIALTLEATPQLVDPTGGLSDLEQKKLVAVREQNLLDDPLRLLRGLRLMAELQLSLEKQTLASRFILGVMSGDLPNSELYYVGGTNTVRGYPEYPHTFANGRNRAILNIEYRILFNDMFQGLVFIDAGWASSLGALKHAKIGKGAGIRMMSPLGPIRLDFGFGETGDMITHFNIGHVF